MDMYSIYLTSELMEKAILKQVPIIKITEQYSGQPPIHYTLPKDNDNRFQCDAYYVPTAEQVCGWLRTVKNISVTVEPYYDMTDTPHFDNSNYEYEVVCLDKIQHTPEAFGHKNTYEDAIWEGINKALDLI